MSEENVVRRGIRSVKTVVFQENSPTHKAGLVIEPGNWADVDPFLLMAEDFFERGTFGMHPHRGIETVTYVIEGKLEHSDNKTGGGELLPGDVQWMTAGRGILHTEDPAVGDTVRSLQLWINLPSDKKMTEPRYQNMRAQDMPIRQEEGATIRVFSGSSRNVTAATENHVPVTMVECLVDAGETITQDLPGSYNGFLYIIEGQGEFGKDQTVGKEGQVLWLERTADTEQTEVTIHATEKLRVLLYAGQPIGEKVVARGPFVMNSDEEIVQAYQDYRDGKFE